MPYIPDDPLFQGGNNVPLNLHEIDPKLAQQGKSVEDISDPNARLVVLWTTIGQYRASAEMQNQDDGTTDMVVNDARYHQLLSTWTRESRRLDPLIRFSEIPDMVADPIEHGLTVQAYDEITQLRTLMPELMHPDIRFTALEILRRQASHSENGRLLSKLIGFDMLDETMPGREGHCDDAERIRRYLLLADDFPYLAPEVNKFARNVQLGQPSQYFDNDTPDIEDICNITLKRRYADVANYLARNIDLGFDREFKLLPLITS